VDSSDAARHDLRRAVSPYHVARGPSARLRFMSAKLLTLLTLAPAFLPAQPGPPQPVTIPTAERRTWKSAITGTEYQVDIALPSGYAMRNGSTNEKRYGVFYILDGNVYFPLATESLNMLRMNRVIADDLIVIGIGYPSQQSFAFDSRAYMVSRGLDYSPKLTVPAERTKDNLSLFLGEHGGAQKFSRFLSEELIPWVDATYRTIPGDRALAGHSLGGLFGVYVLTHSPEMFRKYVIGSPALWFDDEGCIRWEAAYAETHKDLPADVYFYVGGWEQEAMLAPPRQLLQQLLSRKYPGFHGEFVSVPEETHLLVNLWGFEHAFRALYGQRAVALTPEALRRYTGQWIGDGGESWAIREESGRLLIDAPGSATRTWQLYAQSETSFATNPTNGAEFQLAFTLDGGGRTATELKLRRQPYLDNGEFRSGRTLTLHRANSAK
jgi:uncharacterized protein